MANGFVWTKDVTETSAAFIAAEGQCAGLLSEEAAVFMAVETTPQEMAALYTVWEDVAYQPHAAWKVSIDQDAIAAIEATQKAWRR